MPDDERDASDATDQPTEPVVESTTPPEPAHAEDARIRGREGAAGQERHR